MKRSIYALGFLGLSGFITTTSLAKDTPAGTKGWKKKNCAVGQTVLACLAANNDREMPLKISFNCTGGEVSCVFGTASSRLSCLNSTGVQSIQHTDGGAVAAVFCANLGYQGGSRIRLYFL